MQALKPQKASRNQARIPRIELLVVQPTPFCNINCDYCYLPHRQSTERMSETTLRRLFERVFACPFLGEQLGVVWHAGEPLVLPVDYYETAFDLIDSLNVNGVKLRHNFQTNGLLIDTAWLEFFRARQVRLGISIDGPRALHDAHRKTRAGSGTFKGVIAAIDLLNRDAFPFHVISVITADSLDSAEDLFDFYVEHGIRNVGFNFDEIEGANTASSLASEQAVEGYRAFLRQFLNLTKRHPNRVTLREFAGALGSILDPSARPRHNPQVEPLAILSADVQGNLSTFSPELLGLKHDTYGDFVFANVHDEEIADLFESPAFRRVRADVDRGVRRCREECDYFDHCRGGAPANKLFENGSFDSTETLYCRITKKAVIDVVLEDLEAKLGLAS